jgi:hypothetical protein
MLDLPILHETMKVTLKFLFIVRVRNLCLGKIKCGGIRLGLSDLSSVRDCEMNLRRSSPMNIGVEALTALICRVICLILIAQRYYG